MFTMLSMLRILGMFRMSKKEELLAGGIAEVPKPESSDRQKLQLRRHLATVSSYTWGATRSTAGVLKAFAVILAATSETMQTTWDRQVGDGSRRTET